MEKSYLRYELTDIDEIKLLNDILETNKDLKTLNLNFNKLGTNRSPLHITINKIGSLFKTLENNQTLTKLKLCQCMIHVPDLVKIFQLNTTLTVLILKRNNIGSDAVFIADMLKTNQTLTTLSIQNNNIGNTVTSNLAYALKRNTTLTKLSLNNNNIGDLGAHFLAETLKINTSLKILYLKECNIGSGGNYSISQALRINNTLTLLNLSTNYFSQYDLPYLADALEVNKALIKLDIKKMRFGDFGILSLVNALKTNITLTEINVDFDHNNFLKEMLETNYIKKNNREKLCLQIVCLKKLNQLGMIDKVKTLIPDIYASCMDKYTLV